MCKTDHRHTSLGKKYFPDESALCAHVPKDNNVFFLFYDQHGERTDDIERCNDKNEGENNECPEFFRFERFK